MTVLSLIAGLLIWSVSLAAQSTQPALEESALSLARISQVVDQRREALLRATLDERNAEWEASKRMLEAAESARQALKTRFDEQAKRLTDLETHFQQRSGYLGDVTRVVREGSDELSAVIDDSLIAAEHPDLTRDWAPDSDERVLTLPVLERINQALRKALDASGAESRFQGQIVTETGEIETGPVVRLGVFNAVDSEGRYLNWDTERRLLQRLNVQPESGVLSQAHAFVEGSERSLYLDPHRGDTLALLAHYPSLSERLHQGGSVGYVILAIGALGLLLVLMRLAQLIRTETAIQQQLKHLDSPREDNVLGRLLASVAPLQGVENVDANHNAWETRLDEALLQEQPRLERGQTFLKLLAAIAPLLGLLGTVVGMISTFQAITLFGTGDPQVMAGGISQALVTTVLGLVVAIPLLLGHNILSTRSRRLLMLLQEKTLAAMLSRQSGSVHG
ncbi:MAG: MotA/TolQ/ExbB proton channel family protein [Hahellaceae bacterium]|nr:MotA/TolQ/ExbB proton channel family protein [Hahellaceae bacterium]